MTTARNTWYRVPPNPADDAGAYFHNTMVTDLYMGGHAATEDGNYVAYANDYYSIFNVKKLTMNTDCNREFISDKASSSPEGLCDPNGCRPLYRQTVQKDAGHCDAYASS